MNNFADRERQQNILQKQMRIHAIFYFFYAATAVLLFSCFRVLSQYTRDVVKSSMQNEYTYVLVT